MSRGTARLRTGCRARGSRQGPSGGRAWILLGDPVLVGPLCGGLRRAGVATVSCRDGRLDPDDPCLARAEAVLCANRRMLENVWAACRWSVQARDRPCFRWATHEPAGHREDVNHAAGRAVWTSTATASATAVGFADGSHSIDVVEVAQYQECRSCLSTQPLFWVRDGRAFIIENPLDPGPPKGDLAIVLRQHAHRLANLTSHVELIEEPEVSLTSALDRLVDTAQRLGLEAPSWGNAARLRTMPMTVRDGVAVSQVRSQRVTRSHCLVAVVPQGLEYAAPANARPVRLVLLVVSPENHPIESLESLATLESLRRARALLELLAGRRRLRERVVELLGGRHEMSAEVRRWINPF